MDAVLPDILSDTGEWCLTTGTGQSPIKPAQRYEFSILY